MESNSGSRTPSSPLSPEILKIQDVLSNNSTFMQNQVLIQRSPSVVNEHVSALSRKLSTKSVNSYDSSGRNSAFGPSLPVHQEPVGESAAEDQSRGRPRGDSDANIAEATNKCTLERGNSERSSKSARSMRAVGPYPLGTLRVHSPSPTRLSDGDRHECLKSGDVLIVRDVPKGTLIGIDTMCFTVPDQFDGLKDIPPGAHFIWGGPNGSSLRNGFWVMSCKKATEEFGEIVVKRWDTYNEVLEEEVSAAEIRIQRSTLPEFVDKLRPYKEFVGSVTAVVKKNPTIWQDLTSSMKGAFLTKITGHQWNHWQVSSNHDRKTANSTDQDDVLNFVVPRSAHTFSKDSTGRERTEQATDTSAHIKAVISSSCIYEDSDEIIGEIQFCFLTGMFLGNLACMEQWGYVVKVVFRAFRLAVELPAFCSKFIRAVHAQLIYDKEALDSSIFEHDPHLESDLKMILTIFKSRLTEQLLAQGSELSSEQSDVGKAFEELEAWLWKLDWDLRGNYLRSGKVQLDDGESIDVELTEFDAEDERGLKKKKISRHNSRSSVSKSGGVKWRFP